MTNSAAVMGTLDLSVDSSLFECHVCSGRELEEASVTYGRTLTPPPPYLIGELESQLAQKGIPPALERRGALARHTSTSRSLPHQWLMFLCSSAGVLIIRLQADAGGMDDAGGEPLSIEGLLRRLRLEIDARHEAEAIAALETAARHEAEAIAARETAARKAAEAGAAEATSRVEELSSALNIASGITDRSFCLSNSSSSHKSVLRRNMLRDFKWEDGNHLPCFVLGRPFPKQFIVAGHIFQQKWAKLTPNVTPNPDRLIHDLFGEDLSLDSPRNCLLLFGPLEIAFDAGVFCIEASEEPPGNRFFKFRLLEMSKAEIVMCSSQHKKIVDLKALVCSSKTIHARICGISANIVHLKTCHR